MVWFGELGQRTGSQRGRTRTHAPGAGKRPRPTLKHVRRAPHGTSSCCRPQPPTPRCSAAPLPAPERTAESEQNGEGFRACTRASPSPLTQPGLFLSERPMPQRSEGSCRVVATSGPMRRRVRAIASLPFQEEAAHPVAGAALGQTTKNDGACQQKQGFRGRDRGTRACGCCHLRICGTKVPFEDDSAPTIPLVMQN